MDSHFMGHSLEPYPTLAPEAYAFFDARRSMLAAFAAWIETGIDPESLDEEVVGTIGNMRGQIAFKHG